MNEAYAYAATSPRLQNAPTYLVADQNNASTDSLGGLGYTAASRGCNDPTGAEGVKPRDLTPFGLAAGQPGMQMDTAPAWGMAPQDGASPKNIMSSLSLGDAGMSPMHGAQQQQTVFLRNLSSSSSSSISGAPPLQGDGGGTQQYLDENVGVASRSFDPVT
jgi:hypothetical protein